MAVRISKRITEEGISEGVHGIEVGVDKVTLAVKAGGTEDEYEIEYQISARNLETGETDEIWVPIKRPSKGGDYFDFTPGAISGIRLNVGKKINADPIILIVITSN